MVEIDTYETLLVICCCEVPLVHLNTTSTLKTILLLKIKTQHSTPRGTVIEMKNLSKLCEKKDIIGGGISPTLSNFVRNALAGYISRTKIPFFFFGLKFNPPPPISRLMA
jgi:hypothetical protein